MKLQFIGPVEPKRKKKELRPASYIRKIFNADKGMRKATLVITALGCYECFINGIRVGDELLRPGFTNYRKRLQYQEYDVASYLKEGKNVIGIILSDGWYRGALGVDNKDDYYGKQTAVAARITIVYMEKEERIETDSTWKFSLQGDLRECDTKLSEYVDRTKELLGWDKENYHEKKGIWNKCSIIPYSGELIPQEGAALTEHEHFTPKVLHTPDGSIVLDFGQNHAGHIHFKVTGTKGHVCKILMAEELDGNGNFTTINLEPEGLNGIFNGKLGQKLTYVLEDGIQTYKSRFLISGYRYAKLINWPCKVKTEDFVSIAVYSDSKPSGEFSCSNKKINQLIKNIDWSRKSNFVDIPTDCPQRERAGWTGDINVFSETACYLADVEGFLIKWLHDVIDLAKENGNFPCIIPPIPLGGEAGGSAGWNDVIVTLPRLLYLFYENKNILRDSYSSAKLYVDTNLERAKKRHFTHLLKMSQYYDYVLDTGSNYGEWLEPGKNMVREAITRMIFPDEEVMTAWMYYSTKQLADTAAILENKLDQARYEAIAKKIKESYRREFLDEGLVKSKRQCRYIRPVYMGLCSEEECFENIKRLAALCKENDYKIGTGFLTTYRLLQTLCEYGQTECAYKILENEKCPGWLYEINSGATTVWENWQGLNEQENPVDSHNHYAPGSVAAFLFGYCGGIRPLDPGFKRVLIKPYPGGSLTWVNTAYESRQGKIISCWRMEENEFLLKVELPQGITAEIIMPDGNVYERNEGCYEFKCPKNWGKKK